MRIRKSHNYEHIINQFDNAALLLFLVHKSLKTLIIFNHHSLFKMNAYVSNF